MKRLKVDLVDEHFYRPENWFLNQGTRYDNYDRKGRKYSPVNMLVMVKVRSGTISMLPCLKLLL